jgi:SSS family solute:Na+ symporter
MLFPILVILPGLIAVSLPTGYLRVEGYPKGTTFAEIQAGTVKPVSTSEGVPGRGLIPPKMDAAGNAVRDSNGNVVLDYDLAIPKMLLRYFPAGLLGLGLTALLASFMSGMAGNVTAFNTVWTYDIYQAHIRPGASDAHYLRIGRITTVAGIALSVLAAYMATRFNNIMDMLQLIFAFVNAPLFATFLLGMFWKRTTGHGAFYGLLSGTLAAALHHGMTLPVGDTVGIKGGWLGLQLHQYQSDMAQNFWTAIFAWTTCFVVTILISLMTRPREEKELAGLVYSLTPRPNEEHLAWYARPAALGIGVLILVAALNIIFR